ncbi:MAG: radical SAM protein [Clostridia bacterium]|jgi:MoaA/NifB/PqqE/SkfB family radical SAM enzyme|nr:radical SAM protein [Clostridia bacterium]
MIHSAVHKIERKAFEVAIDAAIKYTNHDRAKALTQIVDLTEKKLGDVWPPVAYESLRGVFKDPNSKYMKYANHLLDNTAPKLLKMALLNLGYEAGFRGFHLTQENAKKYGCNIPWVILFDPTSACNLHCTGCWAAEYGNKLNLSFDDMDKLITQGEELGIHAYVLTGGEPLVRKDDVIRLCEKHNTSAFHCFTNGTLIDDKFCEDMLRVGNFVPSISIEGFKEENDSRRGEGTFDKVMHAMDLLKKHKLLFGTSICYTSKNYKTVTSDEFLDMIIDKGVSYTWYFHYMPVGNDASTDLLLTPEQREYMYHRVREIRGFEGGKPIFAIDFQNDGEFVHGCIAGGKYYCHINPNGDVEPCVFIHYSNANIHDMSLIDCLRQPLFKAYQEGQPFNDNMLQPCPMLENPERLQELVNKVGAKSTDLTSFESCEHLCGKCTKYADDWAPVADKLWTESRKEKEEEKKQAEAEK